MKKHFYSHLVQTTDLTLEIANLQVDSKERVHLLSLMEANIHSTVVTEVLGNLSKEDQREFLKNLSSEDHNKILTHLKSKVSDIEDKIQESILKVTKELLEDVKEVKTK